MEDDQPVIISLPVAFVVFGQQRTSFNVFVRIRALDGVIQDVVHCGTVSSISGTYLIQISSRVDGRALTFSIEIQQFILILVKLAQTLVLDGGQLRLVLAECFKIATALSLKQLSEPQREGQE